MISKIKNIVLIFTAFFGNIFFRLSEIIENKKNILILRSKNKGVFFGYYDITPFNHDNSKVLANICSGNNFKTPGKDDFIELAYYDLLNHSEVPVVFDKTNTWCWQQGCRLQWFPDKKNLVLYNKLVNNEYRSVIYNIEKKQIEKTIDYPIYSIDSKGKFGLSLNFSRLQRMRPGYGYSILPDNSLNEKIPEDDGVFLIDIDHNIRSKLISFEDIINLKSEMEWNDSEHYLNHLFFNPTDEFIFCFHLWKNKKGRFNRVIMYNKNSKELSVLDDDCLGASHYTFRSNFELLLTMKDRKLGFVYKLYNLTDGTFTALKSEYLKRDSHPSFIDADNLMIDSYPDKFRLNSIKILNVTTNKIQKIFTGYHSRKYTGEYRCDLHPRLNPDKNKVCIDTVEYNKRVMKIINL